jgi:hypothetical protein
MAAHAQESSWEPVKALNADTLLTLTQQAAQRIRGRLQAADDTTLTIRVHGESLAIPRSSIVEVDRMISNRYFDRKHTLIGFAIGLAFAEFAENTYGSELGGQHHNSAMIQATVECGLIGATIGTWKALTRKDDHMVIHGRPPRQDCESHLGIVDTSGWEKRSSNLYCMGS